MVLRERIELSVSRFRAERVAIAPPEIIGTASRNRTQVFCFGSSSPSTERMRCMALEEGFEPSLGTLTACCLAAWLLKYVKEQLLVISWYVREYRKSPALGLLIILPSVVRCNEHLSDIIP